MTESPVLEQKERSSTVYGSQESIGSVSTDRHSPTLCVIDSGDCTALALVHVLCVCSLPHLSISHESVQCSLSLSCIWCMYYQCTACLHPDQCIAYLPLATFVSNK